MVRDSSSCNSNVNQSFTLFISESYINSATRIVPSSPGHHGLCSQDTIPRLRSSSQSTFRSAYQGSLTLGKVFFLMLIFKTFYLYQLFSGALRRSSRSYAQLPTQAKIYKSTMNLFASVSNMLMLSNEKSSKSTVTDHLQKWDLCL